MPDEFIRALWDPTAPIPTGWPTGAWGALLLFMFPVGGGIPLGILRASNDGVAPPLQALLYLVSDLFAALTNEPILLLFGFLATRIPFLGWLGRRFGRLTGQVGLREEGKRGPLGLVLLSFTVSLFTGRAAAAATGHGFASGWSLAIAGDMLYFLLLMVSTLWLSSVIGDERLTIGVVLLGMFILPRLFRRRGSASQGATTPAAVGTLGAPLETPSSATAAQVQPPRSRRGRRARRGRGGVP